jgi:dihydropteroate synthase
MDCAPAALWQSPHGRALPDFRARTLVMGILNVTPDSFSDGGQLHGIDAVLRRAETMLADGADILDIGGESTRPGAMPVDAAEESRRVSPAIRAIRTRWPDVAISVDTFKPEVAAAAVAEGADVVNDVWGLLHAWSSDERVRAIRESTPRLRRSAMAETVAKLGCPVIAMHNRPDRDYVDFWSDLLADLRLSMSVAAAAGIPTPQLWIDPGFGFVKTPAQNLEVIKHLDRIVALGPPVLVGTSRKSTLGRVLGTEVEDRLEGTAATVVWAIERGCRMIRVHDVREMARVAKTADAIKQGLDFRG